MDLTVLIITKNAEGTLKRTLESVAGWTHNCIVVDGYSKDMTKQIAREFNCKVVMNEAFNFGMQREFALAQVKTEWVLALDSDEVITAENRKEIEKAILDKQINGYYLSFRNHLFGKKLKQGELHKKLVLFRTKSASIKEKEIHETYEVTGTVGVLSSEVLHYSYRSVLQVLQKFFRYSILQARQYRREKKTFGLRELLLNPLHMFYERYVVDGGYKDGLTRIFLDYAFAHMEFLSYFFIPFVSTGMKIGIDCGPYSAGGPVRSGIDRLIQGIYTHASKTDEYYWFSFAKKSPHQLPTRFYSQLWLPLATLVNRCTVFLGTAGIIPPLLKYFSIKKILFIHDFGFFTSPEQYELKAKRLQDQTSASIQIADRIVVFHEEIYRECIQKFPQYSYKVSLIPAGADHLEKIEEKAVFVQPKKPLILYVGVVKPVKRIDRIISAVGENYCVIAGPQEKEYVQKLKIGKTQNIQFIQNFNDGQLKWLYKKADVMVYASEHEGFCYPVLEALSLGLPVIAFNLPLFQEYKKHFPQLTLVQSVEEMKRELENLKPRTIDVSISSIRNPYTWILFNKSLQALWQPARLPRLKAKKVSFIVVLYNTAEKEKLRLEREIQKMGVRLYTIYWIDNSTNGKGYAAGINEGIYQGLRDGSDLLIALNPDISLSSITAKKITEVATEFDVWGFGMKQNDMIYYGGEIDKWRLSGGLVREKPKAQFASVDFVSGSIMGFSKQVVQTIGLWDESYFMYYEDVDYCERARRAGFEVGIDTATVYDHFEISQVNDKKVKWIASSRWKFFWKYAILKQKVREIVRLPKTLMSI